MDENNQIPEQEEKQRPGYLSNLIVIVIGLILIISAVIFYPDAQQRIEESRAAIQVTPPTETPLPTPTSTPAPTIEPEYQPPAIYLQDSYYGALVLSMRDGEYIHLYVYQPFLAWGGDGYSTYPLTRITSGPYQDIHPAVSPDGTKVAFVSNRNGPWDIYILDLSEGDLTQFTDTYAYDGNPSWSPDGQWLAYESYQVNNLEILIQDIDQNGPIPLTNHPGADYAPAWSSQGRLISFISTRDGQQEIWYADLDSNETDKTSLGPNVPASSIQHPTWSNDGRLLTWGVITDEGNHVLVTWDSNDPERGPVMSGAGDWPVWSDGDHILYTVVKDPHKHYLTAYPGNSILPNVMMPPIEMPGSIHGISSFPNHGGIPLHDEAVTDQPSRLWSGSDLSFALLTDERKELKQLRNLNAPYPNFHEDAIGSFTSFRLAVRDAAGWDFLSTLENAYVPLEESLAPGVSQEWLYTGRGLLLNDLPRQAEWLLLVREEYRDHTYWRVYVRANNQSGVQGKPMTSFAWSMDARYSGENKAYENGGVQESYIRDGYWIDFTELAITYGWFRFPAEHAWQFSEAASRYQYFAFTEELDLYTALRQLYAEVEIEDLDIVPNP